MQLQQPPGGGGPAIPSRRCRGRASARPREQSESFSLERSSLINEAKRRPLWSSTIKAMKSLAEYLDLAAVAHGHLCAGQVLGVRLAMLGLRELGIDDP